MTKLNYLISDILMNVHNVNHGWTYSSKIPRE